MDLALFDLDETLICEDSTGLWLRWLVSQGYASQVLLEQERALMVQYYQGTMSMEDYMDTTLAPLAGLPIGTVSAWIGRFIQRDILPRMYPAAKERLRWHQQRGDTVVVISASGEHLVAPIAQRIGADVAMAIGIEVVDSRYTGHFSGPLTYKQGKVDCINRWLTQNSRRRFKETWAYSDSMNDRPMLENADHAWVINPADDLRQLAEIRGWKICNWQR